MENSHDIAVYAGYLTDDEKLLKSSSGGIATALSEEMIKKGGYVAGVAYSEDFRRAEYKIVNRIEDLDKLRGTKYSEAAHNNVYSDVKKLVLSGESVLFIGLPCNVAAMNKIMGDDYDNLITCELICHGPMYSKIHAEYIDYLEKRYKSRLTFFSCRYKNEKWSTSYLHAEFENGKIFEDELYSTEYGYAFYVYGRSQCYDCKFKGDNRTGDIMIGDFWGANPNDDFWNEKGVSAILVHSEKGLDYLKTVKNIKLFPSTFERVIEKNDMIVRSQSKLPERETFDEWYNKKGLIYAYNKMHPRSMKTKIKQFIKMLLPEKIYIILKKSN